MKTGKNSSKSIAKKVIAAAAKMATTTNVNSTWTKSKLVLLSSAINVPREYRRFTDLSSLPTSHVILFSIPRVLAEGARLLTGSISGGFGR